MPNNKHFKRQYLLVFLISIILIFLSFYFRDELASLGSWGLLGIFIINVVGSATLFLPAPSIAAVFAGGIVYSPITVAIIAGLGSAIGDMVGFVLGHSSKHIFLKKDSFWYKIFKETFHKFGPLFIIVFSFIPNPVFDAIGILAGLFSYSPKKFFIYVLIGRFLRNLFLAYLGSAI
ncbi:MAG: VTT domain-containing protein [Candidatus Levybacteria bacterium]|nr:VTT domain-containing protein [Candidatus Levybacteria bacterium]MBI2420610.1 VTT domain-containing protein [Candidatus Levybacteria bacterium]